MYYSYNADAFDRQIKAERNWRGPRYTRDEDSLWTVSASSLSWSDIFASYHDYRNSQQWN